MPADVAFMAAIADAKGHRTHLLDTEAQSYTVESLAAAIRRVDPDLVVVKAKTPSRDSLLELLASLPYPTLGFDHAFLYRPEEFFDRAPQFLGIILGESELTFGEVVDRLEAKEPLDDVAGMSFWDGEQLLETPARPILEDLDSLPVPKYDWFLNRDYYYFYPVPLGLEKRMAFMLTSRGCPMKCIFCSPTLRQTYEPSMRYHSVDRVVEEMRLLSDKGVTLIHFRDDIFTLRRKRVMELCARLEAENLPVKWSVQTHVNHVDEEVLSAMKRAGCVTIGMGLESGSEKVLEAIQKTNKLDHARDVFRITRRLGIKTVGFFLIGNPTETEADLQLTWKLIRDTNPDMIQIALFTPYAGSWAWDNLLSDEERESSEAVHHYNAFSYNFSEVDADRLVKVQRNFYLKYLMRPRNLRRFAVDVAVNSVVNPHVTFKLVDSAYRFLIKRSLVRTPRA